MSIMEQFKTNASEIEDLDEEPPSKETGFF